MAYNTALAAQLTTDAPLDEALVKDVLQNNDDWLYADATAGSGVAPNVTSMKAAMTAHTHEVADDMVQIPAAGVASNAVNNSDMLGTNSVTTAKLANTTVNTSNFGSYAVENDKWTGSLGNAISGSIAFNYANPPRTTPYADNNIEGDVLRIANPKGALGVIVGQQEADWYIQSMDASYIYFGMNQLAHPTGAGSWNVNCRII